MVTIITIILVALAVVATALCIYFHKKVRLAKHYEEWHRKDARRISSEAMRLHKQLEETRAQEEETWKSKVSFIIGKPFTLVVKYHRAGTLGMHCDYNPEMLSKEDWERLDKY